MEIRRAAVRDIPDILTYLEAYHPTSNMKDIKFVRKDTAKVLDTMLMLRDCAGFIARDKRNKVIGVLFGEVSPFFYNHKETYATDTFFIADGAGAYLFKHFKKWAFGKGCNRIISSVSSGNSYADQLMLLMGGTQTGGSYVFYR